MEPKKFIDIFTKKDFRKEIIKELKKEFLEYPYFSPLIISYLLSLRLNNDPNFNNELIKYSFYISNKKKFINLLFEIELIKEKLKDKLSPEEVEKLEKELYLRAKQKHEEIIHEIIEPKIEKMRKLSQITKAKTEDKNIQNKPKIDIKEPAKTQTQEEKIQTSSQEDTKTKSTLDKKEEKITNTTIDDIFKKIEELKKQKLSSKEEFKQRINTIDKTVEEQKIREEVKPKSIDNTKKEKTTHEQEKKEKISITTESSKKAQKIESKTDTKSYNQTETLEHKSKAQEEKQESITTKQTQKEIDIKGTTSKQQKTAADKILEKIQKRKQIKQHEQKLIDKFLEKQPKIDKSQSPSTNQDLSEKSTKEPEIITEKMARIYTLQGLYDKAIKTYEKLILKFPEKSDYFAQKIDELKKDLNNKN